MIARRDITSSPYKILQDQAFARIQELCGNRWTDFNEHDPGVTILDILHYALLELQYSLEFPFKSYLRTNNESLTLARFGIFPAEEIFSPSIVTPADYEKLILENISEIKACRVTLLPNCRYLIEVGIEAGKLETGNNEKNTSSVATQCSLLYHANRNLCETLQNVSVKPHIENHRREAYVDDFPEYETFADTSVADPAFSTEHYSIQNHFPDCYGINEKGIPADASEETQAKIRQLQAYLLIFDYLLANAKQQVKNLPRLLELSGNIPSTQFPEVELNDMEKLMDRERFNKSNAYNEAFLHIQKSHYLDILDTLYGEDTRSFFVNEPNLSVANQKRAELIRQFPQLNANRFRSFNILGKSETGKNSSGIQQFLSAISGAKSEETSIINLFSRYHLRLLNDEEFFREYKHLNVEFITDYVEHQLFDYEIEPIPEQSCVYNDEQFHTLQYRIHFFRHQLLFESFLLEGATPIHYKIADWHKANGYLLIFKIPGKRQWLNLGFFDDKQTLIETANLLWQFLKMLRERSQQIYLVEHILLNDSDGDHNVLTIVIPYWAKFSFTKKEYETLLCERLPAHLEIRFHWLDAGKMYDFEKIYYEWREALASQRKEWIQLASKALSKQININN